MARKISSRGGSLKYTDPKVPWGTKSLTKTPYGAKGMGYLHVLMVSMKNHTQATLMQLHVHGWH
eukprot:12408237-Karenia_brevis.AAC.1